MVRGVRPLFRAIPGGLSQANSELQQAISHSSCLQSSICNQCHGNADPCIPLASTSGRPWHNMHGWSGGRGFAAKAENLTSRNDATVPAAEYDPDWEKVLAAPPTDLYFDRGEKNIPPKLDSPFGRFVFSLLGGTWHKSKLLYGGQRLYSSIIEQGNDATLQRAAGLDPKVFWATYAILSVHVWLVARRLKPWVHKDAKFFVKRFYFNFNQDVVYRLQKAGIEVGVAGWMKKLEKMLFSACIQMDEVLDGKTSKSLSDVLLANFYGNDERCREGANLLARYVSRELLCISMTDQAAIVKGHVQWSSPERLAALSGAGTAADSGDGSEAGVEHSSIVSGAVMTGGDALGTSTTLTEPDADFGGQKVAQAAAVPLPKA